MAYTVAPPPRKNRAETPITQRLREMKAKTDLLFPDGEAGSVKAIASRLARELGRTYQTGKEKTGIRVWRHT